MTWIDRVLAIALEREPVPLEEAAAGTREGTVQKPSVAGGDVVTH